MDPVLVALVSLRSMATLFTLQGNPKAAQVFNTMVSAYLAGRNIDAHLQDVADYLDSNSEVRWGDVLDRISSLEAEFLDETPDPADPEPAPV
jgi:hypothetical protein